MTSWRDAVLSSLHAYCARRSRRVVVRQQLVAEELASIVAATGSEGTTPAYTLSKVLQELRDEGLVEFVRSGEYVLLDAPIDVEDEDLPDEAIDAAIRAKKLRIGVVAADDQFAITRRRRGQARISQLTRENYRSHCAVCDIVDQSLLVASHIVGWAESHEHRGDLSNVICLCRIHDPLFEWGYWCLDDDCSVLVRANVRSKTLRLILGDLGEFRASVAFPPNPVFLRQHRERTRLGR